MMVSVVVITYAHEKFIRQTVESVLNQVCNFPVEIIVSNDSSPDQTDEVMSQVIKNNSKGHKIKYTRHGNNLGMMDNFIWTIKQAQGKYIALCEGDDYWSDPYKLQKQIDFLEFNLSYSMCFHSVQVINSEKKYTDHFCVPQKTTLLTRDLILKHYIPTCSLVFRRDYLPVFFPKWFSKSIVGDIPLEIILSIKGKTKYLDESMAVYRKHNSGITSNSKHQLRAHWGLILLYKNLCFYLKGKYWHLFIFMCFKNFGSLIKNYLKKIVLK